MRAMCGPVAASESFLVNKKYRKTKVNLCINKFSYPTIIEWTRERYRELFIHL